MMTNGRLTKYGAIGFIGLVAIGLFHADAKKVCLVVVLLMMLDVLNMLFSIRREAHKQNRALMKEIHGRGKR